MQLFTSTEFNSLDDLFLEQLQDLYDAEKRLTSALPKMVDAASSPELKNCLKQHLRETEAQVERLENVFRQLGRQPERETCEAMKGLIKEGETVVHAKGDPAVRDAAIIAAAQRVEHYEIAGYGTVKTFAHRLGHTEIERLLQETLEEEKHADDLLTQIAEQSVNVHAQQA